MMAGWGRSSSIILFGGDGDVIIVVEEKEEEGGEEEEEDKRGCLSPSAGGIKILIAEALSVGGGPG